MLKVLVTGSTGLLGCRLVPYLQDCGHHVISAGYTSSSSLNFDLRSLNESILALDKVKPDVIVNLAALTNVDYCEKHPYDAYLLNVKTVENLCTWIGKERNTCHLIHISTDQVYDGCGPHKEDDTVIRNYYALSKLAAEFAAKNVSSTILRTNFIGRSYHKSRLSFTDWLYSALCDYSIINVFDDIFFSPLSIKTLCQCIERCIFEQSTGVFNVGSIEGMSKADFAFAFADALGFESTNFTRMSSSSSAKLVAHRPVDMRMNTLRFQDTFNINLPELINEIHLVADEYRS